MTLQNAFEWFDEEERLVATPKASRTGAFTDNMKLPVHRWMRYSAGFSAEWVETIVADRAVEGRGLFFDPFAGSGTSLLAAQAFGMPSLGAECHPFVVKMAAAKLAWQADPAILMKRASALLARAQEDVVPNDVGSPLLLKCYSIDALDQLEALRRAFLQEPDGDEITSLLWLAVTAILRECSGVGTAQWQYVLPNKTKSRVTAPFDAFERRILMFNQDMKKRRTQIKGVPCSAQVKAEDSRNLLSFPEAIGMVDLVVTSPPYPNNYDYADATRLEMTFWREVGGWGDLQKVVRHKLIRSCSQHSAAEKLDLEVLLTDQALDPIRDELTAVCRELAAIRETKGGKKTYHTMVAAYFSDLAATWQSLRRLCRPGADVCFVIGDSAPYGVHVPAERWLADLAISAGFHSPRFDKIRDRNMKWKNRKHRVPLQEGNLWVQG